MTVNNAVISGRAKLVLYDVGRLADEGRAPGDLLGEDSTCWSDPPGIANGYKAYGDQQVILANAATEPHDPDEMLQLEPTTDRIPYDWSRRDGWLGASSAGLIVTRTPMRVSFAGGGTDLPSFYEKDFGAVLSTAIDKYIWVTVKRHSEVFDEPVRVNYSLTEQVESIDELKNDITRECLQLLNIEPPIYISTVGDLPASTGLGSSSSFAVGLLNALHRYRGDRVSAGQLAEEACRSRSRSWAADRPPGSARGRVRRPQSVHVRPAAR
jgi:hypothetical protein